jgi:PAP2 superfamily
MSAARLSATTSLPSPPRSPVLLRAEVILLGFVAALVIACISLANMREQAVSWRGFGIPFGASVIMMAIAVYVRQAKSAQRLALAIMGFSVFMSFSCAIAIVIFCLFPFSQPMIDPALIAWDAAIGYAWPQFVEGLSQYPRFGRFLGYVYESSLPQIVALILLLAWLNRPIVLYRFLLMGILSMVIVVAIWSVYPSIGPSAYGMVPADVQARIGLVVDAAFADRLMQLATEGIALIEPNAIMGVVAFPSYHTTMACMVVWYSRKTPAFIPALAINLLMIPAILSHGGHHLVDVFAGLVTSGVAIWAVRLLLPDRTSA